MHGYIHVYTGDGKGKTTAALGLALRAAGAGLQVFIAQFMKQGDYSEIKALKRFGDLITVEQYGLGRFIRGYPDPEDIAGAAADTRAMIAAGAAGRPLGVLTPCTGLQVIVIEFVTPATGDLQLLRHRGDRQLVGAQLGQQVADEGGSVSMDQLTMSFCIRPAWGLCPQTPKVFRFGSGLRSPPSRRTTTPRDRSDSRRSRRETHPWLNGPLRLRFRRAVSCTSTRQTNIEGVVRRKGGGTDSRF